MSVFLQNFVPVQVKRSARGTFVYNVCFKCNNKRFVFMLQAFKIDGMRMNFVFASVQHGIEVETPCLSVS